MSQGVAVFQFVVHHQDVSEKTGQGTVVLNPVRNVIDGIIVDVFHLGLAVHDGQEGCRIGEKDEGQQVVFKKGQIKIDGGVEENGISIGNRVAQFIHQRQILIGVDVGHGGETQSEGKSLDRLETDSGTKNLGFGKVIGHHFEGEGIAVTSQVEADLSQGGEISVIGVVGHDDPVTDAHVVQVTELEVERISLLAPFEVADFQEQVSRGVGDDILNLVLIGTKGPFIIPGRFIPVIGVKNVGFVDNGKIKGGLKLSNREGGLKKHLRIGSSVHGD